MVEFEHPEHRRMMQEIADEQVRAARPGAVDVTEYLCPACSHRLVDHRPHSLRRLDCRACSCDVKTKWRYAWAVQLARLAEALKP